MMPPKNMTPTELWSELVTMPRPHRVVPFPRKRADGTPIGEIAIVALTQQEQLQSGIAAEKLIRAELPDAKDGESIGYSTGYSNVCAVEQLYRACRVPGDIDRHAFPSQKEIRAHLSADEIGALYSAFLQAGAEIGPMVNGLSKAEADAWLDKLAEGGEADAIFFFSLASLRTLLACGVDRLRNLQTPLSLPGSQPDGLSVEPSSDRLETE